MTSVLRHSTWAQTFVSTEESLDTFVFLGIYSVCHHYDMYLLKSAT